MKMNLVRVIRLGGSAAAIAAACVLSAATSSAALLAEWTFETSIPATAGPHAAEVGTGSATGFHAGATTYSNPAGNGSVESFSSNTWAIGDYYQFSAPNDGSPSFKFSWDQVSSNTGPRDFAAQYSTDGSTFLPLTTYAVLANADPNPVWNSTTASPIYTTTATLPNVPATTIYLRLSQTSDVSANGGTVASGGTSRVDNVSIAGVPEPGALALSMLGAFGTLVAGRRRR